MKVLLVNKFLFPKGGAETYTFKLGEILEKYGHKVQYFGLYNSKNIVGNNIGEYVTNIDFNAGVSKNLAAPFRIIFSTEAKRKISKVLYDFEPDVVHLNNIQFHLTPSIILAVQKYRKITGRTVKIIYTAHDYQLICPSHGLFDTNINVCEKCLGGNYTHCLRTKCVKNSRAKSFLAMLDAYFWKYSKAYSYIDTIICPSKFLKDKLDTQDRFSNKTVVVHNFIEPKEIGDVKKSDYVLEFGHLSKDKGTYTVLNAAKKLPDKKFVFAGFGEAADDIKTLPNAEYVGFKTSSELNQLIAGANITLCPSEMYENCPYSVIESQIFSTPVIGAKIGGIPELIVEGKTGLLFEAGNAEELAEKIAYLTDDKQVLATFTKNCKNVEFETPETYYKKLIDIYEGK